MKILNLGCSGFVGSHITERLLAEGHTVIGVDVCSDKIEKFIDHENLVFIEDDIRNQRLNLDELVKQRTSQLEVAKEQAESANRAKSTFLANIRSCYPGYNLKIKRTFH